MRVSTIPLLVAAPLLAVCIGREGRTEIPPKATIIFDVLNHRFYTAIILEHPKTQYVLVGDTATFHCKTLRQDAFWLINDRTISEAHLDNKEEFESLGFIFSGSSHGSNTYGESAPSSAIEARMDTGKFA